MTQTHDDPHADDLGEQFNVLKQDAARLAATMARIASDKAKRARAAADEVSGHIAADAKEKADAFRAQAGKAYAHAESSVRRNPALAAAVAVGAGLAIARVVLIRRS